MKISDRALNKDTWNNKITKVSEIQYSKAIINAQTMLAIAFTETKYPMKILIDYILTTKLLNKIVSERMSENPKFQKVFDDLFETLWKETESETDLGQAIQIMSPYIVDYCVKNNINPDEIGHYTEAYEEYYNETEME